MKHENSPSRKDENYSMALHVRENTEFDISEALHNRDCILIGSLRIFLSRDDLEMLADSIATYTGGEFITEKAVRNRA